MAAVSVVVLAPKRARFRGTVTPPRACSESCRRRLFRNVLQSGLLRAADTPSDPYTFGGATACGASLRSNRATVPGRASLTAVLAV
ncbi:MAG: hypothetical protein ACREQ7_05805 [Candidatus Binatia bacterium]